MASEDIFHLGIKAIIRNPEGKVLMLQHQPKEGLPTYWDIPGGRVEKGATIEETLFREVEEETGIKELKIVGFIGGTLSNRRIQLESGSVGLILFVYLCETTDLENITISQEYQEYQWMETDEIVEPLKTKYPEKFTKTIIEYLNRQ